jgi:hypothetical protein
MKLLMQPTNFKQKRKQENNLNEIIEIQRKIIQQVGRCCKSFVPIFELCNHTHIDTYRLCDAMFFYRPFDWCSQVVINQLPEQSFLAG